MKKTYTLSALVIISTCAIAFAAGTPDLGQGFKDLGGLVETFNKSIVASLATMFATLAMVAFFFGIVQFIWGVREGKEQVITDGKKFMGWGLVALFVMFSVWGIIIFVQKIFGINGNNTITIPSIQLQMGGSSSADPLGGGNNTVYTCPDGVTKYYNQSDYRIVCTGSSPSAANPSNNVQTTYTCPDGVTKYYNQSDYKLVCTGSSSNNPVNCAQFTTANQCTSNGCSWDNRDGCSQ